jgi:hypothetical protein
VGTNLQAAVSRYRGISSKAFVRDQQQLDLVEAATI